MSRKAPVCVYVGDDLKRYAFGNEHPFGPDRMDAFWREACAQGLDAAVCIRDPVSASREDIARFHDQRYIDRDHHMNLLGTHHLRDIDKRNDLKNSSYQSHTRCRVCMLLLLLMRMSSQLTQRCSQEMSGPPH